MSASKQEEREELRLTLRSGIFAKAPRQAKLLEYICNEYFQGRSEQIKEYSLATEVLGRTADFDQNRDAIVRVEFHRLRHKLKEYYEGEGAEHALRIVIDPGHYVPRFVPHEEKPDSQYKDGLEDPQLGSEAHEAETAQVAGASVVASQEATTPAERTPDGAGVLSRYRHILWIVAGVAAALGILTARWGLSRHPGSEFDAFWKPAFDRPSPALLVMAHPIVYQPSSRALFLDEQRNGKSTLAQQRAINLPPTLLDGSDYVPVFNQFIGFGDGVAALRVGSLFAQRSHTLQLRLADKVEFNDLYGSNLILIGGSFTNRWTAEMTKNFRYRFSFEGQSKPSIVDSQGERKWSLASITDDRRSREDYIMICRIPHAQTGASLMITGGLAVYGTEAAGRIISDPELLDAVLRTLPKNWASHNLQMVLHVEVVGEGPALPEVSAAYTW